MGLTANQTAAVNCAGRPLFIQAGAGTGKTFTLTKRLAHQLGQESGPLLQGVDNVLIITFTEKAAEELLGRVRAELRAQGMVQAALRIDAAWISTIHGMCRSLLSAHALEAGIDPGMPLLAEEEANVLLAQALEDQLDAPAMQALMASYGVDAACKLVSDLAGLLALAPQGAEAFEMGAAPAGDPQLVLQELSVQLNSVADALEDAGIRENISDNRAKILDSLLAARDAVAEVASGRDASWQDIADLIESLKLPKGGNSGKAFKGLFQEATDALMQVYEQAACARAYEHLQMALELAAQVQERYAQLKAANGVQSMDDLLTGAYRLLRDNPAVAQAYQERFGSIMVDEFQDTDLLQVGIVEYMSDDRLSTLTTVGDAQQSIYGFRGADLETYRNVRARMRELGSQEVELDTNYRSHPDILSFVEAIFSTQEFFGDEFLRIGAGENNARTYPWAPAGEPRIRLRLSAGCKEPEGKSYTGVADLRRAEAQMLAREFAELHEQGAEYGQMALLMSSTKKAGAYLRAMRELGIPCAVSGGSDFYKQPEVACLSSLLRVLELPDDDQALLNVLVGPLFEVSDDALLRLRLHARRVLRNPGTDDIRPRVSLWAALEDKIANTQMQTGEELAWHAHAVLATAMDGLGRRSLVAVVSDVLNASGWLERLRLTGAGGAATAANVQRFCDLLAEYEAQHGPDAVGASEYFKHMIELADEGTVRGKPGRMVGLGNNAVQVMTIHASKGLEFPIVAVAQYERSGTGPRGLQLYSLTEDGERHLSLSPSMKGVSAADYKKAFKTEGDEVDSFQAAGSAVQHAAYAQRLDGERADEEEQRLLYVALTRARDLLLLCSCDKGFGSKSELGKGLFADVAGALFPQSGLPAQDGRYALQNGCLVDLKIEAVPYIASDVSAELEEDELANELEAAADEAPDVHVIPALQPAPTMRCSKPGKQRAVLSYSALSAHEEPDTPVDDAATEAAGEAASGEETSSLSARVYSLLYAADAVDDEQATGKRAQSVSPMGSAFHAFAQWMALQDDMAAVDLAGEQAVGRMTALAKSWELSEDEFQRLQQAAAEWQTSPRFAQAAAFARRLPEYPFCMQIADAPFEGFLDLLCLDGQQQDALVIDYKTGASGAEDELAERYRLQGAVYACAVLKGGLARKVEVVFVRPEVHMQEVAYAYSADDEERLLKLITAAREQ